jgi:hypothetical protein
MDLRHLNGILRETTKSFRKGEAVHGDPLLVDAINTAIAAGKSLDTDALPGGEATINLMPHVTEAPEDLKLIDVELFFVGVDPAAAERHRQGFIDILKTYPAPDRLKEGISYIEAGPSCGGQEEALCTYALGEALGLWKVITPKTLGFTGAEAIDFAKQGVIMMTGFKQA